MFEALKACAVCHSVYWKLLKALGGCGGGCAEGGGGCAEGGRACVEVVPKEVEVMLKVVGGCAEGGGGCVEGGWRLYRRRWRLF